MGKDTYKSEGEFLKALRVGAGLTQSDAANQSGLSAIFLSVVENGKQKPSVRSLSKLASTYNADLPELLRTYGYAEDALVSPRRAAPRKSTPSIELKRSEWALTAIDNDYAYSITPHWETLPDVAKILLIRLYQEQTGRRLFNNAEMEAVNSLIHGLTPDLSDFVPDTEKDGEGTEQGEPKPKLEKEIRAELAQRRQLAADHFHHYLVELPHAAPDEEFWASEQESLLSMLKDITQALRITDYKGPEISAQNQPR